MRAALLLAGMSLVAAVGPAAATHALVLAGSADISWAGCPLRVFVEGARPAVGRWVFLVAVDNVATHGCLADPQVGPAPPFLGQGEPEEGIVAAPPICCLETFLILGPLRREPGSGVVAVAGEMAYCAFFCREGRFEGLLVERPT